MLTLKVFEQEMSKKYHTFAGKLSLKTVIPTSILFIVVILCIGWENNKLIDKRSVDYAKQSLITTKTSVQSVISLTEYTARSISETVEKYFNENCRLDTVSCYRLLEETAWGNSSILGCGFYFAPYKYDRHNRYAGIYVNQIAGGNTFHHEWDDDASTAADHWDYFNLEFFKKVSEGGEPVWLSPYWEYMDGDDYALLISYSYPIKDNAGNVIAVFMIDMSLDWIYENLRKVKPYEHSNVVLLDSAMNVICNPLAENPYRGTIYDSPIVEGMDYTFDEEFSQAVVRQEMTDKGLIRIMDDGSHAFLVFDEMDNGWILCISSIYSDVYADLHTLWTFIPILLIISLLILYFLNRQIIHRLAEPINKFASAARKITDGKFDEPIPICEEDNELAELGNAMRYMQDSVTAYIKELETTTVEKEKLKSELDVARNIQGQMLSKDFPSLESVGIFADSCPAREVGGDLYDFTVSEGNLYFILGDVSGKSVPAALLMAITIAAFRSVRKKNHSVEEIVSIINDTFCKSNENMMFVTLVVGKLNMATGEVELCNAGHNPIVLISPEGKADFIKARANVACGVMQGFPYERDGFTLQKGSRLILYSDGVTEAEDKDKAQYGESRLLEWAGTDGHTIAGDKEAVSALLASVRSFTDGAEQNDDISIMSITL